MGVFSINNIALAFSQLGFLLLMGLILVLICFSGNLLTRYLGDIVKKEHFVLDSEYLTTLLVVVQKYVSSLYVLG